MTTTILQECKDIVLTLVGHEYLYFDNAVEVRVSPHSFPFNAWAVCVGNNQQLYVMDSDEAWHGVDPGGANAALIIGSLYQRLKMMRMHYAKAS